MRDLVSGAALLAVSVAVWLRAGTFPSLPEGHPGPALFPRVIAVGLGLAAVALLVQGARRRDEQRPAQRASWPQVGRLAFALGLVLAVPLVQPLAGLAPLLGLVTLGVARALGAGWVPAAVAAVGMAAVLYGLFAGLLGVPL